METNTKQFLETVVNDINMVLLLISKYGDRPFLFEILSSCKINRQLAKFYENLSVGSISVEYYYFWVGKQF